MLLATTADAWGITGAQFLWGYGALCVATGAGVRHAYRQALGPPAGPLDPLPELSVCEIGILNDGPDCATTAAAARLYYDGLVRGTDGTLVAIGELDVWWLTALAERIPPDKLSRVTSYDWTVSLGLVPLGYVLAGPAADAFGATKVLLGGSLIAFVAFAHGLLPRGARMLERLDAPPADTPAPLGLPATEPRVPVA